MKEVWIKQQCGVRSVGSCSHTVIQLQPSRCELWICLDGRCGPGC